jgi:hypothetical protein
MTLFETPANTECLYSTLRNISLTEKFFGFLPPHGRRLACGEEITVWGDIQHWLTRFTPNDRARRSLEAALGSSDMGNDASIAIVNTPAVHLRDITDETTRILKLDDGKFVYADPCWGSYSSQEVQCS